ncbi:MAG TPA: dihydrolipoyl dehydrogenase [Bacillota bacterium]|nr:dihydrolipoyl dehydrogenase [Bacillota bacterium]
MPYDFDVVVIGGGPGGYVAAIRAAQLGKKTCLVEKQALGGVCLNRGCIPTKTIIKSINVLNTVKSAEKFGVRGVDAEQCRVDLSQVQQRKRQVVKKLTGGVAYLLNANGVEVVQGEAGFIDNHTIKVGERAVSGEHMIIATGSLPVEPPIPKEGNVPVLVSDEVLELTEVPGEVAIIGGGVIGIEFAFILSRLGAGVTVIELMEEILPAVDMEIAQKVKAFLKAGGVVIHTGAKVTNFVGNRVYFRKNGAVESVKADKILLAAGRKPDVNGLSLEAAGVRVSKNGVPVNTRMQTNVDSIYAVGDVNGRCMLAHVASMEGMVAVENICGNEARVDYGKAPRCIYLDPEIASAGMTEREALEKGLDIKVGRFSYSGNGKAVIEAGETGFIKVIIDRKLGEIIGAHMIGAHATEMIAELVLAMNLEGTAEELIYSIHPHPSISEVIPEAFHAALHKAIHAV